MCHSMILDTETTGFNEPEVIELAYRLLANDLTEIDGAYCQRFNPSKEIEKGAVKVHGIKQESLKDSPSCKGLLEHAPKVMSAKYIIGHFIEYDIAAINHSVGEKHTFKTICTKRLALEVFKDKLSYSLVNLTKSLGVIEQSVIDNAHSADADVYMTMSLLEQIVKALKEQTGKDYDLDALYLLCSSLDKKHRADYA